MKTIKREDIDRDIYQEIFAKESHHTHEIQFNEDGIFHWKPNQNVLRLKNSIGIDILVDFLESLGHDKNSEICRKFFRDMGYSLLAYWEIFYWETNNPIASEYSPSDKVEVSMKSLEQVQSLDVKINELTEENNILFKILERWIEKAEKLEKELNENSK